MGQTVGQLVAAEEVPITSSNAEIIIIPEFLRDESKKEENLFGTCHHTILVYQIHEYTNTSNISLEKYKYF